MASASDIEFALAECKWLASNPSLRASSSRGSVASSSSSESDFEILDSLDTTKTEVALEQLRKWVNRKSRQLSMSKRDRQHFQEVTSRYFAELNSTLSREAAEGAEQSDDREAGKPEDADIAGWLEEERKMVEEELGIGAAPRADEADEAEEEEQEEEVQEVVVEEEGEQEEQLSGTDSLRSQRSRILCLEEDACLFSDRSNEYSWLLETLHGFLNDNDDYFRSLSMGNLLYTLRVLVLYNLEHLYDKYSRSRDQALVCSVRSTLQAYQQLFEAKLSPHMFRQAYNSLENAHPSSSVRAFNDQVQLAGSHDVFLVDGMLLGCWETFSNRTGDPSLGAIRLQWQGTCCICTLEDQLVVRRECCTSMTCYDCYTKWVKTNVFARTVEVGCPCCGAHLTAPEILEFLGDSSGRYYEIITDLNGDPRKKTCPNCNLVTEAPGGKARKRAGGQLLLCSRCEFTWCFRCQSPPHPNTSCKANSSGKHLLREWGAATYSDGSQQLRKARRCPSCKVWIEKNQGCNHMTCSHCHHEFCYICGKDWRGGNLLFGRHSSRLSIFGCKQKLLPRKPVLRKLIRGTLFVLETIGIVVGAPVLVGLLLALSPILGIIGIAALIYKCKN